MFTYTLLIYPAPSFLKQTMKSLLIILFLSIAYCQVCNVVQSTVLQQNLQVVGNLLVNGFTNSSDFIATNCNADLCTVNAAVAQTTTILTNGTFCPGTTCAQITNTLSNFSSNYFSAYVYGQTNIPPNALSTIVFPFTSAVVGPGGYSVFTGVYTNPGGSYFADCSYTVNVDNVNINTTGSLSTNFPLQMTCSMNSANIPVQPVLIATNYNATGSLLITGSAVVFVTTTLLVQCTVSVLPGRTDFSLVGNVAITGGTFTVRKIVV